MPWPSKSSTRSAHALSKLWCKAGTCSKAPQPSISYWASGSSTTLLASAPTRTRLLRECTQRLFARTWSLSPLTPKSTTNPLRYSSLKTLTEVHGMRHLSFFRISMIRLIHGQASARSGRTCFTMYMPRSSLPTDFLRRRARTRVARRATSSICTSSWMPCFSSRATLHVRISRFRRTRRVSCRVDADGEWTVLSARDAWIQADANRYAGANKCLLWHAFASRGLGVNAANHNDDSTVPAGC